MPGNSLPHPGAHQATCQWPGGREAQKDSVFYPVCFGPRCSLHTSRVGAQTRPSSMVAYVISDPFQVSYLVLANKQTAHRPC